ncbi:glycosyltransferase family 4 protein [Fundicoccus sp. Sow4_D5]|uniref:glycosyltransferase family 4 protein n=1 Tax=Fundicoccus sp. Sow4_D5 TaxID=3438782 RepID=UPI003F8FC777
MEKICIIHLVRDTGGVAKMMLELANEQARNGLKVVIFHTSLSEEFIKKFSLEIDVHKIKLSPKVPPMLFGLGFIKAYRSIEKSHPSYKIIVHAHNIATIGLLSKTINIPIVCTIHGISWFGKITFRKKISRYLTGKRLRYLSGKSNIHLIAVSKTTAEYYNNLCKKNIMGSIYNGIERDIKRKPQKEFTIGFIGDISEAKGWGIVLEAISLLNENIRNDLGFIAAGGSKENSEQEIEKQIDNLKMDRRAKYLGLVSDAYHSVTPNLDLLLLPSLSEGLPMAIIEAQSLGIPVIATAVGGIPEIVINGNTGIIVERNATSVSNAIEKLYTYSDSYKRMSSNAEKNYMERFTSKGMHNKYLELYLRL